MGIFQQFPYTNFHDLNLDWFLTAFKNLKSDVENMINNLDSELLDAVNTWVSEHPGYFTKDYLTPDMFGAVCDGVTDDSAALQECVNQAAATKMPIKITKDIFIDSRITVPAYVRFDGNTHNELYPYVIAGENCDIVFDCISCGNVFKDFGIKNYNSDYRLFKGIVFNGDSRYNVDSEVDNMSFSTMDECVVVKGRNCKIINSFFGQSRIGIHFDLPAESTQYRGLQVEYCRFHEIGSFADLGWFENSACVWIHENTWSNLTIRNCIADQSGTFFYGYCTNGIIENNFVESFKKTIINFTGIGIPANIASLLIDGNSFNGKYGSVLPGVTVDMPEHIIEVSNTSRINITNNIIRTCKYEMITLDSTRQMLISGNTFINAGTADPSRNTAILCDNVEYINIIGNTEETGAMNLYSMVSDSIIYAHSNSNFKAFAISGTNVEFLDNQNWVSLGTCAANSPLSFNLPKDFMVRLNDGRTSFYCTKQDNYYSQGISFSNDGLSFYVLSFKIESDNIVPVLRLYNCADIANPTSYAYTLTFYSLEN